MILTGVGSASNARFGYAIVNIGDINKDRYNDVAIGAPLEEDHGGSIYIFNGKIDGIHKTYSQVRLPIGGSLWFVVFRFSSLPTSTLKNNRQQWLNVDTW